MTYNKPVPLFKQFFSIKSKTDGELSKIQRKAFLDKTIKEIFLVLKLYEDKINKLEVILNFNNINFVEFINTKLYYIYKNYCNEVYKDFDFSLENTISKMYYIDDKNDDYVKKYRECSQSFV